MVVVEIPHAGVVDQGQPVGKLRADRVGLADRDGQREVAVEEVDVVEVAQLVDRIRGEAAGARRQLLGRRGAQRRKERG